MFKGSTAIGRTAIGRTVAAAVTVACLGAVTLGGSAGAAEPPPTPVPVMPGTSMTTDVLITDDGIYTMSMENGRAVYHRTLTTDASGTTLGPATFVGHSTTDGGIAVHDGTIAYARAVDGRLVLAAPDRTEALPAWDDDMAFLRGMNQYTGTWISAHTIAMRYRLFHVTTGAEVDLRAITPTPPAEITNWGITSLKHTDARVLWTVAGHTYLGDDQYTYYSAAYTSELDANGPTGPVVLLDEDLCESPYCGFAWPQVVEGDVVAWHSSSSAGGIRLQWFTGEPYAGTPSELHVPSLDGIHFSGTELVVTDTLDGGSTVEWFDLTSATPAVAIRTAVVPGWVIDVHGTLVAYQTATGDAMLVDVTGLPITADPTPVVTPGFSDVAHVEFTDAGFSGEIQWLADHGIVGGYPDGTFRPLAPVNRDAMAAFLYRAAHDGARAPACTTAAFADVPASHPFCGEITWLASTGITTGWPDGTFRPGTPVTREAMAAFLYRFAHDGADAPACTTAPFTDVTVGNPFCGEIQWLADTGISTGWPDGTFRPAASIERQAMAAFLFRFIDAGLAPTPI